MIETPTNHLTLAMVREIAKKLKAGHVPLEDRILMTETKHTALYAGDGRRALFTYVNHRGETSLRDVEMRGVFWGTTDYHPEPGWMLQAFDLDKREHRIFAMKDISDVR